MIENDRMKVLILSQNSFGCGASIAAFRIAESLANSDINVSFHFQNLKSHAPSNSVIEAKQIRLFSPKGRSFLKRGLRTIENRLRPLFLRNDHRFLSALYILLCIKRICHEEKFDLVNFHNWNSGHYLLSVWNPGLPVVWTMHDEFASSAFNYRFRSLDGMMTTYGPGPNKWLNIFLERIQTDKNIHLISPSIWLARLGDKRLLPANEVHVINQTADDAFFPIKKNIAKECLGIPQSKKTILFLAGNGAPDRKGHLIFKSYIKDIADQNLNIMIVGDLGALEEAGIVFQRRSIGSELILNIVYNAADYFIVPSLIDNHPNTIIESLFAGTPVLCSNRGGMPEMIIPGVNGQLFNPYKKGDLMRSIKMLKSHKFDKAVDISNNAKARYSKAKMADNYKIVFEGMIDEKNS